MFLSKAEQARVRQDEAEAAEEPDYTGCPVCDEIPEEAHMHGGVLYQGGVALF